MLYMWILWYFLTPMFAEHRLSHVSRPSHEPVCMCGQQERINN